MRFPIISDIHNHLTTDTIIDEIPLSEYPRPNLIRDSYICLNGKWKDGTLVPFCLQSVNSGHKGKVVTNHVYERDFVLPDGFVKDKVLLHFGAVDCECEIFVNGTRVGEHKGGYNSFVVDITKAISRVKNATNTLKVLVYDKLSKVYPYGKQKKRRGGMWYTPVTGIWKTVWIESVSDDYIRAVEFTTSLSGVDINIDSEANNYEIFIYDGDALIKNEKTCYDLIHMDIDEPKLWSPDSPHLYNVIIKTPNDQVKSYFGLRTVSVKSVDGHSRILLNDEPFFFHAVLDQGYFPEGIYTPNSIVEYEKDILRIKELGFNTIRMHIKVESDAFYAACDRLGMIVFQDMVNNGSYNYLRDTIIPTFNGQKRDDTKKRVKLEVIEAFCKGVDETLTQLYNYPSIVYYSIFNEGWGQFKSDMMYDWVLSTDPTRIIDSTSGWFWQEKSDVDSYHVYFHDFRFEPSERPVILSEFGGLSYRIKDHAYTRFVNYGYGKCKNGKELTDRIVKMYERDVLPGISKGLCGSVYTQAFDVEDETNGLYTYDRIVCKVEKDAMIELARKLRIGKSE